MPYDISASDPWADNDWTYNPAQRIKASRRWAAVGITDAQLMLIHRLLPDYERHIEELKKKSQSVRNDALHKWRKTVTEALLKHVLFDDLVRDSTLSTEEQVKKYHDIASRIIKKFQNHKNQKVDKKEPSTATITQGDDVDVDIDDDRKDDTLGSADQHGSYKLLFQLLKFSGTISGQKLFEDENKDKVAVRSQELCDAGEIKSTNPGGADRKALKELWLELSEDERNDYDRKALDAKQDELLALIYSLLKEIELFLGPATFLLVYTFRNELDGVESGCINVSNDKLQTIGSILNPDFANQLRTWADIHMPRHPVRQLRHTFAKNSDGIIFFPRVDLQQTPLSKLKILMDEYFYSLWVQANDGATPCPDLPYSEISKNVNQYFDTERWPSLPTLSCPPTEMSDVETILMATYLKNNSCEGTPNPFYFRPSTARSPTIPNPSLLNDGENPELPNLPNLDNDDQADSIPELQRAAIPETDDGDDDHAPLNDGDKLEATKPPNPDDDNEANITSTQGNIIQNDNEDKPMDLANPEDESAPRSNKDETLGDAPCSEDESEQSKPQKHMTKTRRPKDKPTAATISKELEVRRGACDRKASTRIASANKIGPSPVKPTSSKKRARNLNDKTEQPKGKKAR
ncbi:uncharacterized protein ARMOST_14148 [Armillaria ostoyae]|uniref:Uncharacterized protein n=1 Tax=Armillaria ostoyae TaxID=47428 RepID=A0A284RPT0_ARMOS|nr:uncharacterized protein ARMOST_14148 [Armillaria ostoyae]